ncbi:MAG: glycosyltransferase [bacterium]|nr:glycosyltransferase [bacterium]
MTTDQDRDRHVFFSKMGIHQPFDIVCLQATNTVSRYGGKSWYELFMFFVANLRLTWFFLMHTGEFDAVYFRDESLFPAVLAAKMILQKKVFFEIHSVLESKPRQFLNTVSVRWADGVIAISSGLKRYYQKSNHSILLSLCSAAEDSWFDYSQDRYTFRKELELPNDLFLIGYTGVVGANPNNDYYEVDDIVKSLASLPTNIVAVIVGELNENAGWLREIAQESGVQGRVIIVPWQERSEIPKYLQAFDIILIPKRKKDLIGDSPAKMFPALASRRPIVGGHTACIEEVLTDGADALIIETNTPKGWAKAILKIYNDRELAQSLSNQAWITKDKYTWEKRGIAIAEFIKKTLT